RLHPTRSLPSTFAIRRRQGKALERRKTDAPSRCSGLRARARSRACRRGAAAPVRPLFRPRQPRPQSPSDPAHPPTPRSARRREADRTSCPRWPCARFHSSAATRPRYSATLLVAVPIGSENSSTSVPSGRSMRTPKPAGPGLPRAPPSMYATKRPALKRPAPSGVEESTGRLRNGCGEIENALTAVALDDAVVAAHVVEHLRPHADVADRAD